MRSVQLSVRTPAVDPAEAFARISDFERYADLVDVVRSVTVQPATPGQPVVSDWAVDFRNGTLRWTETDHIDAVRRTITFQQTAGDFEEFSGDWTVRPAGMGCEVEFRATFDFGIPSLAGILDPIAGRVLKETIALVLAGLLGAVEVSSDDAAGASVRASVGDDRQAA